VIVALDWSSWYGVALAAAGAVVTFGGAASVLARGARAARKRILRRSGDVAAHAPAIPAVASAGRATDRVAIVRAQYEAGRRLEESLVWPPEGAPETVEADARQRETARQRVCEWAKATWAILNSHFPAYESEFYGEGRSLGPALFATAYARQIKELGGDPHPYLEQKLRLLAGILERVDTSPAYVSAAGQALQGCLADAVALRARVAEESDWAGTQDAKRQVEQWAEDASAVLRVHAQGLSPMFTRFSSAGESPEQIRGYLDMRIRELEAIAERLPT
jgi:hypothetical protein